MISLYSISTLSKIQVPSHAIEKTPDLEYVSVPKPRLPSANFLFHKILPTRFAPEFFTRLDKTRERDAH